MPSLLLRLLLCATLLFNSMASAVASAHVAMMAVHDGAAGAEAAQAQGQGIDVDCPHAAMQAAATQADPPHAAPASPAGVDRDCLQQCIDICLQHCQAVITAMPAVATAPHAVAMPMPALAGQAAPMLHPLLRPPIAG